MTEILSSVNTVVAIISYKQESPDNNDLQVQKHCHYRVAEYTTLFVTFIVEIKNSHARFLHLTDASLEASKYSV